MAGFDDETSSVFFGDPARYRQSKPGALIASRLIELYKSSEDAFPIRDRNARTIVGDAERETFPLVAKFDFDMSFAAGVLDGVLDDV
jgi:hypothetical protein